MIWTVEIGEEEIVIPLEVEIEKKDIGKMPIKIKLTTDDSQTKLSKDAHSIMEPEITLDVNKGKTVRAFYIKVNNNNNNMDFKSNPQIAYNAELTGVSSTVIASGPLIIKFTKSKDQVYSLSDYLNDSMAKLEYVTKVESENNILTVYGYHKLNGNAIVKRKIKLKKGQSFLIGEKMITPYKPQLSLLSVPFKVRPKVGELNTTAVSGLTNLGFNIDFFGYKRDCYYANGNKSTIRISFPGVLLAPAVEELDSILTKGYLKGSSKSKQLFISTGLTLTVAYNNLTFLFVPIGFDFATSKVGREWIYKQKRWWGFGIGVDPKIFAAILNK